MMQFLNKAGGGAGGEDVTAEVQAQKPLVDRILELSKGQIGTPVMWLTDEAGEIIAPIVEQSQPVELPTAQAGQIAIGYTAYTADGIKSGSGKVVKNIEYGTAVARFDAGNGRYFTNITGINIEKISTISAQSLGSEGILGLTITVKKDDNPLGYIITTLAAGETTPIKTEHAITDGILRLEAFGNQFTKIEYSILEEN